MYPSSEVCGTCTFATQELSSDTILCEKYGQVSRYHHCSLYQFNLTQKQPPKRRILDTSRFSKEDFSIDEE